jgi:hypothetical protein
MPPVGGLRKYGRWMEVLTCPECKRTCTCRLVPPDHDYSLADDLRSSNPKLCPPNRVWISRCTNPKCSTDRVTDPRTGD